MRKKDIKKAPPEERAALEKLEWLATNGGSFYAVA
jgi:hypothetical protein